MALPSPWVDKIFEKLTLVYGRDFIGRWEGLDIESVKADWAHELDGFNRWPEAIKHGLECLSATKPPTVLEFREWCRRAPARVVPQLPSPDADPQRVGEAITKARAALRPQFERQWAVRLQACEARGDELSMAQRDMWRAALEFTPEVTA